MLRRYPDLHNLHHCDFLFTENVYCDAEIEPVNHIAVVNMAKIITDLILFSFLLLCFYMLMHRR